MIHEILDHYRSVYKFTSFYNTLLHKTSGRSEEYPAFLEGLAHDQSINTFSNEVILTNIDDVRVDLPVWFGAPNAAKKIVIMGMEPRDTVKTGELNIERHCKYVYGTPFALEVSGNKYRRAFESLIGAPDIFVYFTDVVKRYDVKGTKADSDRTARNEFWNRANDEANKAFLMREFEIIGPDLVIGLGNVSHRFLESFLPKKFNPQKVTHPAAWGGVRKAQEQLEKYIQ